MASEKTPQITGEKILAETKFLVLKQLSYLDKSGQERTWDMVSRARHVDAVMIVPFYGDKLVVIREFRIPIGGYTYSLPAGLIDAGESAEETARRELYEETGLEIRKILAVSPPVYNSPGLSDEAVTLVYAEVDGTVSQEHLEASEAIEPLILSRDEIAALLQDKTKNIAAKAWMEFYHFANKNNQPLTER